mmetsp:Transcript_25322/g.59959  ORF Transcript_25322/g.59959 Transcript_25322/m.59959 type:complete len:148 (-) Transcript_25322:285-728(-)
MVDWLKAVLIAVDTTDLPSSRSSRISAAVFTRGWGCFLVAMSYSFVCGHLLYSDAAITVTKTIEENIYAVSLLFDLLVVSVITCFALLLIVVFSLILPMKFFWQVSTTEATVSIGYLPSITCLLTRSSKGAGLHSCGDYVAIRFRIW